MKSPALASRLRQWPRRIFVSLFQNPIIRREVRSRLRSKRQRTLLIGATALNAFVVLTILAISYDEFSRRSDITYQHTIGNVIFYFVIAAQTVLAIGLSPAAGASAIAAERERQTYDLLRTTMLSARSLVWGKFVSSAGFILLVILAQTPYLALAVLFGGVTTDELLAYSAINVVSVLTYTSLALLISAFSRRSSGATVGAYAMLIVGTFILPAIIGIIATAVMGRNYSYANYATSTPPPPNVALDILAAGASYLALLLNAPASMVATAGYIQDGSPFLFDSSTISGYTVYYPAPWVGFLLVNLMFAAFFLWWSIRRVRRRDT